MCSEAVLQRCSPRKMIYKHEANSHEACHTEAPSQQSRFSTLLKSHPHTHAPPKVSSTPSGHPHPGK